MRIVLITEEEPYFGAECMSLLLDALPDGARPVRVVLAEFAPAGSRFHRWETVSYFHRVFGTQALLAASLRFLCCRAGQWGSVAEQLNRHNIDVVGPVDDLNGPATLAAIRDAAPDLLLSFSVNRIFGPQLLAIAPCMNLHLSLLPRHRGLMPVFWALHDGDNATGVTVHRVDSNVGVDAGGIVVQHGLAITERRLVPLYGALKRMGMRALAEAVGGGQVGARAKQSREPIAARFGRLPERDDVDRFRSRGNRLF